MRYGSIPHYHTSNELRKQISEIAVASSLDELIAVRSTPAPGKVVGLNNAEVSILAADKATGHAVGSDLVIIDEGGLLSEKDRDLWNACLTSISGRSGRLICISIRGDSPILSELSKRKNQSGVVWHEYAATAGCDYMDKKQWHKANPGLRSKIKSIEYMKHTALRAKSSPADAPTFLAYDLNLPQSPTRETIVSVNDYTQCVVSFNELPDRAGPVFVGIDLGGSSSMTAAVAYWPDTHRLECVGAFGNKPGLKQRGQSDGVGSLYEQMYAKNELKVYEGYATPIKHFIKDIALLLEGQQVAGVACDRYRKSEFLDALYGARVPWSNRIEFRGQGSSMVFTADGAYDVRSFQVAVLERRIKVCRSLLLEHSIANSSISRDAAGNCKLDRATQRGRIDTLQAGVLALGLGARYRERSAGGGAKLKLHIIQ